MNNIAFDIIFYILLTIKKYVHPININLYICRLNICTRTEMRRRANRITKDIVVFYHESERIYHAPGQPLII